MRRRIYIALKHYYLCTGPHDVTTQNSKFLVSIATKTANLTSVVIGRAPGSLKGPLLVYSIYVSICSLFQGSLSI
jgi:hypothetical protein